MNNRPASHSDLRGDCTETGDCQSYPELAGQQIAKLLVCANCDAWWGSSDPAMPLAHLILRLVSKEHGRFLWSSFYGWQRPAGAHICPACGHETAVSALTLFMDDEGQVAWPPELAADEEITVTANGDPFQAYIEASPSISENIAAIASREVKRQANTWAYTADIDDLREQLETLRDAFKDTVYRYAPILPSGWRVTGDFDKWLKGQACAGFLHGEINPDHSLMVGGHCTTLADLEMQLDRLHHYVCELSC